MKESKRVRRGGERRVSKEGGCRVVMEIVGLLLALLDVTTETEDKVKSGMKKGIVK